MADFLANIFGGKKSAAAVPSQDAGGMKHPMQFS
jgi:hypothetical protein